MSKRKPYIPNKKYNPITIATKIERLEKDIQRHKLVLDSISKSHDNYISQLGNFAKHDIKNAIQSMDSILSTTSPQEFDDAKIESLSTNLEVIRGTMDNFAKLVPYSTTGKFNIKNLMIALELLSRVEIQKENIFASFDFPKQSSVDLDLPFQAILQMLNNLMLNSIKALETNKDKKIKVITKVEHEKVRIEIEDNGSEIPLDNISKIFEFGFTTTGGSGIGLFHAKYLCEQFNGNISVSLTATEDCNKRFTIILPITLNHGKDYSDN